MKEYVSYVLSNRDKFTNVQIARTDIVRIQQVVLNTLNLKNINELRDMYEGMAFYNNFLKRIKGLIALEKVLEKKLIDWDNINAKTFVTSEIKLDKVYDLIVGNNLELPIIQKKIKDRQ